MASALHLPSRELLYSVLAVVAAAVQRLLAQVAMVVEVLVVKERLETELPEQRILAVVAVDL